MIELSDEKYYKLLQLCKDQSHFAVTERYEGERGVRNRACRSKRDMSNQGRPQQGKNEVDQTRLVEPGQSKK